MTAPVGFLDFFVLEASEYVDQLDGLLLSGGTTGPDLDALQRTARALRGSATMAKLPAFAEMASGIERIGHALRQGSRQWEPGLGGALVAAVDDCKILLRNVRAWSPADESRSRARIAELARFAPARFTVPTPTTATPSEGGFLITEVANIGAGAELLATRPTDRDAASNVLRRVRALRGIASVKDHPSLGEVLEATEHAAHPLERGEPRLSAERVALLASAATVLRGIATAMRQGGSLEATSPELARFAAALDAMQEHETEAERVVPIDEMFFDDGGATVVQRAPNPPTSPAERFRLEVVSQGEHLRRLVADARSVRDDLARERVRRSLRQALRGLRQAAESFGERDVAEFVSSHNDDVVRLDAKALDSLEQVATLLAQPGSAPGSLGPRVRALRSDAAAPPAPSMPVVEAAPEAPTAPPVASPSPMMTPVSAPAIAPPSPLPQERDRPAAAALARDAAQATPAAAALGDLLDAGIQTLGTLRQQPLVAPVAIAEQPAVPIDVLLYRGRAAIERCREIRDQVRGSAGPVDAETLGELFDLLDLALTE
jgi:chemotaxis protein histidine kinase CheA